MFNQFIKLFDFYSFDLLILTYNIKDGYSTLVLPNSKSEKIVLMDDTEIKHEVNTDIHSLVSNAERKAEYENNLSIDAESLGHSIDHSVEQISDIDLHLNDTGFRDSTRRHRQENKDLEEGETLQFNQDSTVAKKDIPLVVPQSPPNSSPQVVPVDNEEGEEIRGRRNRSSITEAKYSDLYLHKFVLLFIPLTNCLCEFLFLLCFDHLEMEELALLTKTRTKLGLIIKASFRDLPVNPGLLWLQMQIDSESRCHCNFCEFLFTNVEFLCSLFPPFICVICVIFVQIDH